MPECAGCHNSSDTCQCTYDYSQPPPLPHRTWDEYSKWYYDQQAIYYQQHSQQSFIPFPSTRPLEESTNSSNANKRNRTQTQQSTSSSATANPQPRQRRRANGGTARPNVDTPSISSQAGPAVNGVGPITQDENSTSRTFSSGTRFDSLLRKPSRAGRSDGASQVWYFVRGLVGPDQPSSMPVQEDLSTSRPSKKHFSHVGCRLCDNTWTTWNNVEGQTKTIQTHLEKKHGVLWRTTVYNLKLKGWQTILSETDLPSGAPREAFTLPGFYARLIKWITADDQSIRCVDTPELRDLLLYLGQDMINEKDLPHRTKLTDLILEAFKQEYDAMIERISNSLGRVSFTSDIWSSVDLQSYMAITAHYILRLPSGRLELRTELVAFRALDERHTGENIAKIFLEVIKEIGCLNKIGMVTLDNASNNNTSMSAMAVELGKLEIPFNVEGNRIRCFPHVVNIAVKHGLKQLTTLPADDDISGFVDVIDESAELRDDPLYAIALGGDVVDAARRLVAKCRASDQRRKAFRASIIEGNTAGGWGEPPVAIPLLQLLKDVETRWSSTFLMIDRLLMLYMPVKNFIENEDDSLLLEYGLTDIQLKVLDDVRTFLSYAHTVQELVSAQQTPTLSLVIPLYEQLIVKLRALKLEIPKLQHAIEASVNKLEEYMDYSRKAKIYNLAIVINPTMKFRWLIENWSESDCNAGRKHVRDAMLEFQAESHSQPATRLAPSIATPVRRNVTVPSIHATPNASRAQKSGLVGFMKLGKKTASAPNVASTPTATAEERSLEDERVVDREISMYETEGLIGGLDLEDDVDEVERQRRDTELEDFDILRYWEARRSKFPLLFKLAMDVLPAQASSVPCERVFSSSKETDTLRRTSMDPGLMEVLQILKFIHRHDRLSFFGDLICTEEELTIIDIAPDTIHYLLSHGQVKELVEMLNAAMEAPVE